MSKRHEEDDLFAYWDTTVISAYHACPETDKLVIDEADTKLKSARTYPIGFKDRAKNPDKRIRIRYHNTNDTQAEAAFHHIMLMYRRHVIKSNPVVTQTYPFLEDYLIRDPLGVLPHEVDDARIYKNASKLVRDQAVRGQATRTAGAQSPEVTLLDGTSASATQSGETESPPKTKKSKAKKKGKGQE